MARPTRQAANDAAKKLRTSVGELGKYDDDGNFHEVDDEEEEEEDDDEQDEVAKIIPSKSKKSNTKNTPSKSTTLPASRKLKKSNKRKPLSSSQSPPTNSPVSNAHPSSSGSFQYTPGSLATIFIHGNLGFSDRAIEEVGRSFSMCVFSPLPRGSDEVAFQAFLFAYWKPLFDMISQGELFTNPTTKLLDVLPMLPYIWCTGEKEGEHLALVLRHSRCDDGTPFQCTIRRLFDKRQVVFSRPGSSFTSWLTFIQGYLCDLYMQLNGNFPEYTKHLREIPQSTNTSESESQSSSSSSSSSNHQGMTINHSNKQMAMLHSSSLYQFASVCRFVASQISTFIANNEQSIRNQANAFELLHPILPASEISTQEVNKIDAAGRSKYDWTLDKVETEYAKTVTGDELVTILQQNQHLQEQPAASEVAYFIEKKAISCDEMDMGSNHLFLIKAAPIHLKNKASRLLENFLTAVPIGKRIIYMQVAPTQLHMSVDIVIGPKYLLLISTHEVEVKVGDGTHRIQPNDCLSINANGVHGNTIWMRYFPHHFSRTPGVLLVVDAEHPLVKLFQA